MRTVEERKKVKADEKRNKEKEYHSINEEMNKQTILKRELDDNVKIMEKEKEIKQIETKIHQYRQELQKYGDCQDFQKDRGVLQERLHGYLKRKAEIAGRLQGFEDDVKRCKRDLRKMFVLVVISPFFMRARPF